MCFIDNNSRRESATIFHGLETKKMSELKLRKLMEHTQRLREQLELPRIKVSEASHTYFLILI